MTARQGSRAVKRFSAGVWQQQFVAQKNVELAVLQQACKLFLRHGVAAEQEQLAPALRWSASSSRRSVHCRGCSSTNTIGGNGRFLTAQNLAMRMLPSPVVISSSGPPPLILPRMRARSMEPFTVTGRSSWMCPSPVWA